MPSTPRARSIFVRVLLLVVAAGLLALGLSLVVTIAVAVQDKEASLTESAIQQARSRVDELDRRVDRAGAQLAAVALAADAGRPFAAGELLGPDLVAVWRLP